MTPTPRPALRPARLQEERRTDAGDKDGAQDRHHDHLALGQQDCPLFVVQLPAPAAPLVKQVRDDVIEQKEQAADGDQDDEHPAHGSPRSSVRGLRRVLQ
jgi:hypothetical protein